MDYSIGQLAALSGVTVRALHHYEKLGLLPPSWRTPSGYRRYTEADVLRLHRILVCRQMGVSLKDIGPYLGPGAPPLRALLMQQAAAVEAELDRLQKLQSTLKRIVAVAEDDVHPALSHHLLRLMTTMQSIQQHYTADELHHLHSLRDAMTPDVLTRTKTELAELIRRFGEAAALGTDPADHRVGELAQRWVALGTLAAPVEHLRAKTRSAIDNDPQVQRATGITPDLKAYIDAAVAAARVVDV